MRPLSWLIAAALVHLLIALLVLLFGAKRGHGLDKADAHERAKCDTEIDIAFTPPPEPNSDDGQLTIATTIAAAAATIGTNRAHRGEPALLSASSIESSSGPPDNAPPATTAEPSSGPPAAAPPQLSLGQLGIGAAGSNPFLHPGALGPDKPSDPRDNTAGRALKTGLLERDLALGLGPEGPVLEALRDATSMSASPERGYAIFAVSIDDNGFVKDIRLGDRAGGPGWDEAMNGALKNLKGKKLALRGGAKGAELKIEIKSDVVLPSGNRPDQKIKTPMTRSHVSRPENVPGGTPDVVETRTVATFDITDIGAKPRRVVHAHLVSATML